MLWYVFVVSLLRACVFNDVLFLRLLPVHVLVVYFIIFVGCYYFQCSIYAILLYVMLLYFMFGYAMFVSCHVCYFRVSHVCLFCYLLYVLSYDVCYLLLCSFISVP